MSNQQKEHDLWNLSENLRATATVLSELDIRASCYAADYTKAYEVLHMVKGLLANVEVLIEAAQAAQYISRSSTKKVLTVSVALRKKMWQYKSDLQTCLDGSEDGIVINRPSTIYKRVIKGIRRVDEKYGSNLYDLRNEIDAERLMKTEDITDLIQEMVEVLDIWMNVTSVNNDLGSAIDTTELRLSLIGFDRIISSIPFQQTREDTKKVWKTLQGILETDFNRTTGQEIIECVLKFSKQLELCQIDIRSNNQNPAKTGQPNSQNTNQLKPGEQDISAIIDKVKELKGQKEKLNRTGFLTPVQREIFNAQIDIKWYIWKLTEKEKREHFYKHNIPIQYVRAKKGRFVVTNEDELKLYAEDIPGVPKYEGERMDLDEKLLVDALKDKLKNEGESIGRKTFNP